MTQTKNKALKKIALLNNERKRISKKKGERKKTDKTKLKREKAFLHFLAVNPHDNQNRKFLSTLLLPSQYAVLREIAVNELAGNLPETGKSNRELKKTHRARLNKLAKGELKKSNLHHIFDLIRILAQSTVRYHDLC